MATRTQADLITQILIELSVVPEGVAPAVEDTARVQNNLPSLFEEIAGREIVYVADPQNIPSAWFMPLAVVCAYELRRIFGITGQAAADLKLGNDEAIGNLKMMTRGRPTYEPLRTVTF